MGSQSWTRLSDFDFISLLYSPALAVRVTNRFKRLDQVYLKNYGRRSIILYRRQRIKPSQRKKQEGKVVIWGGFTKSWTKKRRKNKGKRERYIQQNTGFQRTAQRQEGLLQWTVSKTRRKQQKGVEISSGKLGDTKGTFHSKRGTIKDRNGGDLVDAEELERTHRRTVPKRS